MASTSNEDFMNAIADKVASRLKEHRLPGEYMDAFAQGSYRYNLFTKAGEWAAFEITTAGDGESLILCWLNGKGEIVGKFTIWREEEPS